MKYSPLIALLCVMGCAQPPANVPESSKDQAILDALEKLADKLDHLPPPQQPDTSGIERELREVKSEIKAAKSVEKTPQTEKPKRVKATGWTGCLVHLDGVQGRCPPCEDFKTDMERYKSNPDHAWTFGRTNESHFKLQYHQTQDIALPAFEYYEDGSLIHTIEGYPRTYETAGYLGPLGKLIEAHPSADHEGVKATYKAERSKSRERWGGYGTSSGSVVYGAPVVSGGSGGYSVTYGAPMAYGSNGGGYQVYRMRQVIRPARVYSVPMYSNPMSYGVGANCYGGVCVP